MKQRLSGEADRSSAAKHCAPFMVLDGWLSSTEGPASGPYPEPDESSPHPHSLIFKILFNIITLCSSFLCEMVDTKSNS
jgi:hypothetical protein